MKIAINCAFFQPRGGGIAEYIYNLVKNIESIDKKNEYILYVLKDQLDYAKERNLTSRFRIKVIPYGSSYGEVLKRSLFAQSFWKKEEMEERFDLFHSPFFHSPSFKKAKVILTVHDLRFYRFPYTYTLPRYLFLKYKVRQSVKLANHIISISQFTKDELMDAYNLPNDKITVIHEAINRERFSALQIDNFQIPTVLKDLESGYILSVGHIEPRKNYERLIESFRNLKKECHTPLKLVIVGKKGHHFQKTLKLIEQTRDVVYLDFVSHEMLVWLYTHANLFVFPSFYEGFGFPPLEAGVLGIVSAVSNVSSMPEVCGDAVAYFNPYDVEDMSNAIKKCLTDIHYINTLKDKVLKRVESYSWIENARQTVALYNRLAPVEGDTIL